MADYIDKVDIGGTEYDVRDSDAARRAANFTVTLTAAGWSSNAQTVSNSSFVTSGYTYVVSPASGSFTGYASAVIYADDVTTAGKMTFHCVDTPAANLTVNVMRLEAAT